MAVGEWGCGGDRDVLTAQPYAGAGRWLSDPQHLLRLQQCVTASNLQVFIVWELLSGLAGFIYAYFPDLEIDMYTEL